MREECKRTAAAVTVLLLCAGSLRAQQAQQSSGSTSGASPSNPSDVGSQSAESNSASPQEEAQQVPPLPPLTGAKDMISAARSLRNSYVLPSLDYAGILDTNPTFASRSNLETLSVFGGRVELQDARKHSRFDLDYSGHGFSFGSLPAADTAPSNGSFHRLGVSEEVTFQRWKVLLDGEAFYLPESLIGFPGFSVLGSMDVSLGVAGLGGLGSGQISSPTQLNPALIPSQSVLTGRSPRLSDVGVGEIQYEVNPRSTLTGTVAYGTLHFFDSGFVNSDYLTVLSGYNYRLTARDYLGVSYTHTLFRFDTINHDVLDRGVQLAYSRELSGTLSLELSGGPVASQIGRAGMAPVTKLFFTTYDSLRYESTPVRASLTFLRYISGGSGVLSGAETDVASLLIGRRLGRQYHGDIHFTHTFNQSLIQEASFTRRIQYELWEGGVLMSRDLGERWTLFLSYDIQKQNSNNPICVGNGCVATLRRQVASVGLSWHGRPIQLR